MFRYLRTASSAFVILLLVHANMMIRAQVEAVQETQQSLILADIQKSIIRAIGAQDKTVDTSVSSNILTVARVNSNMNQGTHGGRDNEAMAIASIVSKTIFEKKDFKNVTTIRVQYLTRDERTADTKVIDTVEFRKDTNGVFQLHRT